MRDRRTTLATAVLLAGLAGCASTNVTVQQPPASTSTLGRYSFEYAFTGNAPIVQVFDDGANTFVQFKALDGTAAVIRESDDARPIAYGRNGPYAIVPGVHSRLTVDLAGRRSVITNSRPGRTAPSAQPAAAAAPDPQLEQLRAEVAQLRRDLAAANGRTPAPAAAARAAGAVPIQPQAVRFADNSTKLDGPIDATALRASLRPGQRVVVTGYTDAARLTVTGSRLARARALTVRNALVAAGVPAESIRVRYYGAGNFASVGTTQTDRALNRRVTIEVAA